MLTANPWVRVVGRLCTHTYLFTAVPTMLLPQAPPPGRPPTRPQRVFTVLMYLNQPGEGGATWWPAAFQNYTHRTPEDWYSYQWHAAHRNNLCARHTRTRTTEDGLMVAPKAGRAVIFLNYDVAKDGFVSPEQDWAAVHAGCHVLAGEKYVANQWINAEAMEAHCSQHRMGRPHPHSDPGLADWLRGHKGEKKSKRKRRQHQSLLRERSPLGAIDGEEGLNRAQHGSGHAHITKAAHSNSNVELASSENPKVTGSWSGLRAKLFQEFRHKVGK